MGSGTPAQRLMPQVRWPPPSAGPVSMRMARWFTQLWTVRPSGFSIHEAALIAFTPGWKYLAGPFGFAGNVSIHLVKQQGFFS